MKRSFRNDGSMPYVTQNEFTAYLCVAISRAKARYLKARRNISATEISPDEYTDSGTLPNVEDAAALYSGSFTDLETEEQKILLSQLILRLSEREQRILSLKVFDELSFKEIAQIMSIEQNTVKTTYYRTLKKLRSKLEV